MWRQVGSTYSLNLAEGSLWGYLLLARSDMSRRPVPTHHVTTARCMEGFVFCLVSCVL